MSWLFPAGIVASLALIAIVLLHMRHRLPEVIPFPQLAFWPRVPSETRESPRWRKPPLTLLFLLQLLAALLLVLAFMRPAIPGLDAFGGQRTGAIHHLVVLDGSTSMLASGTSGETRWDEARAEVDRLLGGWQEGDGLTLVVAGNHPVIRSAADSRQLGEVRDWLARLDPPGGVPDGEAVSRLLGDAALPGLDRRVTVVTDGGLELAGVDEPATTIAIGDGAAGNVAIVSTATSPLDNGGFLVEATVLHDREGTETIPWVAQARDQDVASGTVTLGAGATGSIEIRVPAGVERVRIDLVADDALQADNRAVVAADGGLAGVRVVLVSDVPGPLQRALEVLPGASVEVYPSTTPGIRDISASADLVVYEAAAPAEGDMPAAPMLLVQPPGEGDAWQVTGVSPDPALADVNVDDPVMRDIPLEGVRFGETPIYVLPEGAEVLASGTEQDIEVPLIWRGTLAEQPYIAWAFDPAGANITDRVAFPLLVAQTTLSLAGSGSDSTFAPGDLVTLRVPAEATAVEVENPLGRVTTLAPRVDAAGSASVTFPVNARAGAFGTWGVRVLDADGEQIDRGSLYVNAGDPVESHMSAVAPVTIGIGEARAQEAEGAGQGDILTEIWPLLVVAAIGVVALEWWIWLARSLPGRRVAGGSVR